MVEAESGEQIAQWSDPSQDIAVPEGTLEMVMVMMLKFGKKVKGWRLANTRGEVGHRKWQTTQYLWRQESFGEWKGRGAIDSVMFMHGLRRKDHWCQAYGRDIKSAFNSPVEHWQLQLLRQHPDLKGFPETTILPTGTGGIRLAGTTGGTPTRLTTVAVPVQCL